MAKKQRSKLVRLFKEEKMITPLDIENKNFQNK